MSELGLLELSSNLCLTRELFNTDSLISFRYAAKSGRHRKNLPSLVSFDGGLSFKTKLGLKTQTPIKKTKLAPAHSHGATNLNGFVSFRPPTGWRVFSPLVRDKSNLIVLFNCGAESFVL